MSLELLNYLKCEKGMTNEELADCSGVPFSTVAKIMSGRTRDPKFEIVSALARVLGCTLSELDSNSQHFLPTTDEHILIGRYCALDNYGRHILT